MNRFIHWMWRKMMGKDARDAMIKEDLVKQEYMLERSARSPCNGNNFYGERPAPFLDDKGTR